MRRRAVIRSVGHGVPEGRLTNADLERLVDTDDAWIRQRTGIVERRKCGPGESTGTLCLLAAREALERAGMQGSEIDLVVVGTVTGDMPFPATSCMIQHAIGAKNAGAMDVGAACAGFIYAVATATAFIESGAKRKVLVIGGDALTKILDFTDRTTCVLFGDGAGAVIMEGVEGTDRGVIQTVLFSDGSGASHINMEFGGNLHPAQDPASEGYRKTLYMAGAEVYRFAVTAMGDACCRVLEEAKMSPDDIDLFVPHQANLRIIQSAAERLKLPPDKVFVNVDRYGNTSGGSVPIGLYEAVQTGRLKEGMVVMTVGFGAGLVWGANLIRW